LLTQFLILDSVFPDVTLRDMQQAVAIFDLGGSTGRQGYATLVNTPGVIVVHEQTVPAIVSLGQESGTEQQLTHIVFYRHQTVESQSNELDRCLASEALSTLA
jgi:hypothetical protein